MRPWFCKWVTGSCFCFGSAAEQTGASGRANCTGGSGAAGAARPCPGAHVEGTGSRPGVLPAVRGSPQPLPESAAQGSGRTPPTASGLGPAPPPRQARAGQGGRACARVPQHGWARSGRSSAPLPPPARHVTAARGMRAADGPHRPRARGGCGGWGRSAAGVAALPLPVRGRGAARPPAARPSAARRVPSPQPARRSVTSRRQEKPRNTEAPYEVIPPSALFLALPAGLFPSASRRRCWGAGARWRPSLLPTSPGPSGRREGPVGVVPSPACVAFQRVRF